MKLNRNIFAAMTIWSLFLVSGVFGAKSSINEVLQGIAGSEGVSGIERTYNFNDVDRSQFFDMTSPGEISVGDIIRGSFEIDSIELVGGIDDEVDLDTATANALFGRFALEIVEIRTNGDGTFDYVMGATGELGTDVIFDIYEAPTYDFNGLKLTSLDGGFTEVGSVAGATAWTQLGGSALEYEFTTRSGAASTLDLVDLAALSIGTTVADLTAGALDVVGPTDGTGIDDPNAIDGLGLIGDHNVSVSGSIFATPTVGLFDSEAAFRISMTVVPTPAAILPGIVLMGIAAMRRNRKIA